MATQSLYRRYRPRRFSELKGQDHVVRALRTSVAEGREGQAYLFSGPRGTGKTTSARILAKVLNCTNPDGGEPCCECESCLAVERGTSYDVHELDAASNNGVDAMRELIDRASLGTPGRHKVYILDEVHMLTKPAEAALLKTLEEPPPHVVFVLATTDPQKMSDTIRSRTQHLQFHLFSADELEAHVRWVATDAGLDVSDAAIEQVVNQGAGSARDALSALELVANSGGDGAETVPLNEFVESMIEQDAGRALAMAAGAIALGRDPRTLTEELIGYLRNGFLTIMAPELVQLPSQRVEELSEVARRIGAAGLVRGIEQLGAALIEMRQAPDPRVLLDVAIVNLTMDRAATDLGALVTRIAKLERQLADGVPGPAASTAPVDPASGRATLGGRARRAEPAASAATSPAPTEPAAAEPTAPAATASAAAPAAAAGAAGAALSVAPAPAPADPAQADPAQADPAQADPAQAAPVRAAPAQAETASALPVVTAAATDTVPAGGVASTTGMSRELWEDTVKPGLRGMARAVFAPAEYVGNTSSSLTLALPNPVHREKCEQHRTQVEDALAAAAGGPVTVELVLGGDGGTETPGPDGGSDGGRGAAAPPDADTRAAVGSRATGSTETRPDGGSETGSSAGSSAAAPRADTVESPRRAAERAAAARAAAPPDEEAVAAELPADDEVDLTELIDAPPEHVKTPIDRLAEAFPGSEMVEEKY